MSLCEQIYNFYKNRSKYVFFLYLHIFPPQTYQVRHYFIYRWLMYLVIVLQWGKNSNYNYNIKHIPNILTDPYFR